MASAFRQKDQGHVLCSPSSMGYPYPPHHAKLPYTGRNDYFLTFCTLDRLSVFTERAAVTLVYAQIVRAAAEKTFEITAYCFMPDHVHLLVNGLTEDSDCKAFIKAAKQYSGYHYKKNWEHPLWQRYGYERIVRDAFERAFSIGYIVANPVRAGLTTEPGAYPYLGSQRYTLTELLEICEYSRAWV